MIRLAADEDLDNDIVRALRRRLPTADVLRVQDAGLSGHGDPAVLEWAATSGRVLITHDVSTMTKHALDRLREGRSMLGIIVIPQRTAIGAIIEDLVLLVTCSVEEDLAGQVLFLPLR